MYIALAVHGLTYGMLLFLVASGLTLIFGMMGILNIAHASFFMLAGYFCVTVLRWTESFWLSLLLAPIGCALVGCVVERFFLRRIQRHGLGHIGELLLTLGISLIVADAVKAIWGTGSNEVLGPVALRGLVAIGGWEYPAYRLFIIGVSLALLAIMATLLFKTRLGMILSAAVSDADMVSALGINMPRVFTVVFGLGTWMAGVAGVAATPLLTVFPGMADQIGLDAFVVVVVGGLGNLVGAFVASLIIGEIYSFGIQFIPRLAPVLMFVFMALVLSFKPSGLFGGRE